MDLLWRLREVANARVRAGEITGRELARRSGLSQPHVHHFLDGARGLTPAAADRLLAALNLAVEQLLGGAAAPAAGDVPWLGGLLGGGLPFPRREAHGPRLTFPPALLCRVREPAAALVAPDPAVEPWFAAGDLALLDLAPEACHPGPQPAWFAAAAGEGVVLRRVWREADGLFLTAAGPPARVPDAGRNILEFLRARLVWIGRKLDSQTPLGGSLEETRAAD